MKTAYAPTPEYGQPGEPPAYAQPAAAAAYPQPPAYAQPAAAQPARVLGIVGHDPRPVPLAGAPPLVAAQVVGVVRGAPVVVQPAQVVYAQPGVGGAPLGMAVGGGAVAEERYCGVVSCLCATVLVFVFWPAALFVPCCPCDKRSRVLYQGQGGPGPVVRR